MKAILEFTLPEEQDEHQTALDGGCWKALAFDFDQWLRSFSKHSDPKDWPDLEAIRNKLHELASEGGLEI